MKVYLAGAHSCGKSTLARYVSEKHKLPMITEVSRMILSEQELRLDDLRVDLDLVDNYQTQVFYRQLEEESKYTNFVSDRTFDSLAYAAQHSRVFPILARSDAMKSYVEALKDPEVFIFFVRPQKSTMKADGVRETLTWDGIIAIDAMIKMLLEVWNLRHFSINMENMQERARLVDSVLSLAQ